jgi:hypothetical protein
MIIDEKLCKVDRLFNGRLFSLNLRVRKPSEVEWNFRDLKQLPGYALKYDQSFMKSFGAMRCQITISLCTN